MGRRVRAFLAFLYDFVIGDDWRIAVAVVAGLAVTYAISQTIVPSWWVMPALVVVLLPATLWRATRRR
jgi:phage shock protein PspC (stress-responsive transcriptional regulator)